MNCGNEMKMKKWSPQWTQFMQLRKEAWKKIQDFNGVWTPDLVITGAMLYQLSYEATDVGSRSNFFHGNIWTHNRPAPNISGFIAQLIEHCTGIPRSQVQTPLKSWIFFQASLRNCINCVHCDDHFFIFISFPQFIHDLFHISLTLISFTGTYEPTVGRASHR